MADSTVEIEIKALDNMSNTLKKIENNTSKSMGSLKGAFTSVQGAMLNLGQVAQGIHQIFEIQEQQALRTEMAYNRVENAEINLKQANQRLADSQQKIVDLYKKQRNYAMDVEEAELNLKDAIKELQKARWEFGVGSDEELRAAINYKRALLDLKDAKERLNNQDKEKIDAQQAIIDAQDGVTKATNNLENAVGKLNKVLQDAPWTKVDMGMQILSVAGNVGALVAAFGGLFPVIQQVGSAILGLIAGAGPIGLLLLAIGAAVLIVQNWDKIWRTLGDTWNWIIGILQELDRWINKVFKGTATPSGIATGNLPWAGAMQTKTGGTVNINGPVYGVNANDIASALYKKVSNKIT